MSKLIAAAVAAVLLLTANTAAAHTDEQLDTWVEEWQWELWRRGGITNTLFMQRWDMANRHPCYFRDRCLAPPPHTHTQRVQPPASESVAGVEQWRSLVATYFRPSDVDRALRIMQCESGGNPNARNPGSSASGLLQHLARYWPTRSVAAGWAGADIFNPEANIAVGAWLRDQPGGWLHWVCR